MTSSSSSTKPIVISSGNTKLGKIPNVNLPPIISCQKGIPCAKQGCYSLKAYRMYPNVREARHYNWDVWNADPDKYFTDICNYIDNRRPNYFRWHSDGDIPSQQYLAGMATTALRFPSTKMLAFTKNYSLDLKQLPTNLVVIPSVWPDYMFPKHLQSSQVAYMLDTKLKDNRIRGFYFECSGHCTGCWACWSINTLEKDVVFHKH